MFSYSGELFELKKNKITFEEICQELRNISLHSPWELCFPGEKAVQNIKDCGIQELHLSKKEFSDIADKKAEYMPHILQKDSNKNVKKETMNYEEQLLLLKTSLMSVQDSHQVEYLKGIEFISLLPLYQVPHFCESLFDAFLSESSVALFLTSILSFEKPLGITVAANIINCIVYPKILSLISSNCRNLCLGIVNFSTVYPKAIIDELLVPCLKRTYLETPLLEILIKISKVSLPEEHISYCIKNILKDSLPTDNAFVILQNLIKRKIPYENNLHNSIASTIENWVPTSNINIKFTKLLISILSTYGNQLTDQQMNIYSNAIKENSTIMKKAAENVLKML